MLQTSESWSYTGATWFISGQGRSHNPCNIHAEHSRACAIADVSKIHYKIRKIPPDPPLPTESPHNDCSVKGTVCRPETTVGRIFATSAVIALIFKKGRARTISKMSIRATAFFLRWGFLPFFCRLMPIPVKTQTAGCRLKLNTVSYWCHHASPVSTAIQ